MCLLEGCDNPVSKGSRFCSVSCANKASPKRKPEGTCKACGVAITKSRTYCKPCFDTGCSVRRSKYTKQESKVLDSKYVVSFRQRTKARLIEYKGGKCIRCGYSKCSDALEFHHLDPSKKDFSISGKSLSFDRLKSEADKCILVCSNCHKEIHHELRSKEVL